jgi:hypothetical protein
MELPRFGFHVLRLVLLESCCDRSAHSRFCVLRSPTFVVTSRAVPDIESDLSRQAKVTHGRSQQHVTAGPLPFCSEHLSLLFNEGEHLAVRKTVCGNE